MSREVRPYQGALQQRLHQRLQVPCKVWSSYTIESTLLKEVDIFAQLLNNLFQSKGMEYVHAEVPTRLASKIEELVNTKRDFLANDETYRRSITGQIQNRVNNLRECLDINNVVTGGEAAYFQNFEFFARNELQQGRVLHLANKDDISEIINSIATSFNPAHIDSWGLEDIINVSEPGVMYQEWSDMVQVVTG